MMMIAFGTRPEFIKLLPIIEEFKKNGDGHKIFILFVKQHETLVDKSLVFDREIDIGVAENRLDSILSSVLCAKNLFGGIDSVMVQGDTATAYAIALAAFHRKIPVIHVEAGLRTYDNDNPYPEEYYRRSISALASVHFCATSKNFDNLEAERIRGRKYVVGNTSLDNIRKRAKSITYENKILVTLHRRENIQAMNYWFHEIDEIASCYPDHEFVLPLHPNPEILKHAKGLNNIKFCDPMNHNEVIDFMASCKFIITDSGGLQEESSYLAKRSIICRKTTERTEGLGIFSELCYNPYDLKDMISRFMIDFEVNAKSPYGDGFTAEKIYDSIKYSIRE